MVRQLGYFCSQKPCAERHYFASNLIDDYYCRSTARLPSASPMISVPFPSRTPRTHTEYALTSDITFVTNTRVFASEMRIMFDAVWSFSRTPPVTSCFRAVVAMVIDIFPSGSTETLLSKVASKRKVFTVTARWIEIGVKVWTWAGNPSRNIVWVPTLLATFNFWLLFLDSCLFVLFLCARRQNICSFSVLRKTTKHFCCYQFKTVYNALSPLLITGLVTALFTAFQQVQHLYLFSTDLLLREACHKYHQHLSKTPLSLDKVPRLISTEEE